MKSKPNSSAGQPSGKTPYEKFRALASALVKVPKAEAEKARKNSARKSK